MTTRKKSGGLVAALAAALILAGVSPGSTNSLSQSHSNDQIVVGMSLEPLGFYPLRALDSGSYYAQTLVYEGLVRYAPDMSVVPAEASSFQISPDGLTYTFALRKGLRFSDGTPITKKDINATIVLARSKTSPFKSDYQCIETWECVDDKLTLHLSKRSAPLLSRLVELRILPEKVISAPDHGNKSLSRHPVGSGPFRLARWESGLELVFERNPFYSGARPKYDRLIWRILPDKTLTGLALEKGEIDVAQIDPATWKSLQKRKDGQQLQVEEFLGTRTVYLGLNTGRVPFKDVKVRQALAELLDRKKMVSALYRGYGIVPNADISPGSWAYSSNVKSWNFDTKAAAKSLREAGYEFRDDGWFKLGSNERLCFRLFTIRDYQDVAQVVSDQLRRAGVDNEVQIVEYATLRQRYLTKGDFDAVLWSRSSGPDPECSLVWGSDGALNYSQFKRARLDDLIASGRRELDVEKRKAIYAEIQSILAEEVPWVFLVQPKLLVAHRASVSNIGQANQRLTGLPWDNPLFNAAHFERR